MLRRQAFAADAAAVDPWCEKSAQIFAFDEFMTSFRLLRGRSAVVEPAAGEAAEGVSGQSGHVKAFPRSTLALCADLASSNELFES